MINGPEFALFNDEAHNSPAPEYEETLIRMHKKIVLRVDTTATPDRADGQIPDSHMIFEYDINDALYDRIIKTPVIYQSDIESVQLTYTDARTGEQRKVEEIDWEDVDRLGLNSTHWVTDDNPMRQQMAIALKRLDEQERRAKGRYQPLLFIVVVCKADAEKVRLMLTNFFNIKTLLITEDSDEADREKAGELGSQKRAGKFYKAVISVLMLREGWHVPEVGVILLLRKFSSSVYGQQVIGRGLRRVRTRGVEAEEPQICAVVDHPKLEHDWLWPIFDARKRMDVSIDDQFDETEDLPELRPKQELVKPNLVIDVPDPSFIGPGEFQLGPISPSPEPRQDWQEVLANMEYDPVATEITAVNIAGIIGQKLASQEGWTTIHSAPDDTTLHAPSFHVSDAAIQGAVKDGLLRMAECLTVKAGYAAMRKDCVYSTLLHHLRTKFLNGSSLGLGNL